MTRNFAPPAPKLEDIIRICRDQIGHEPTSITELRGGAWSSVVALETPDGPMVMRFSQTMDDFQTDKVASQFDAPGLPIPKVYGIGKLGDRWWCLSQRMPGIHLDELDASGLEQHLPSLAEMLIAMREVSSTSTTGFGSWDSDGNGRFDSFAAQLLDVGIDNPRERGGGWSERLARYPQAQRVFDDGMEALSDLTGFIPDVRQLIHQDTINYNVTVDNGRISGVFDWGCAMWGDALYDLAWFRFWDPWYPQWASVNLPDRLESLVGVDGDNAAERIRCYLLHIGLGHIRYNAFIENWSGMDEVVMATEALLERSLR